jgi:hypothetical protein
LLESGLALAESLYCSETRKIVGFYFAPAKIDDATASSVVLKTMETIEVHSPGSVLLIVSNKRLTAGAANYGTLYTTSGSKQHTKAVEEAAVAFESYEGKIGEEDTLIDFEEMLESGGDWSNGGLVGGN